MTGISALTLLFCFAVVAFPLVLQWFQQTWIWFQDVRITAVPAKRDWSNAMSESLILVLQNSKLLQQATCIDHALLIVWNGDRSNESYLNEYLLFGYQTSPFLAISSLIC